MHSSWKMNISYLRAADEGKEPETALPRSTVVVSLNFYILSRNKIARDSTLCCKLKSMDYHDYYFLKLVPELK